jgi:tetratricopeptide (TPR) repeat protein
VLACVALLAASLIGQDLGSSNKLFGAAKTKTSAARPPVKKPAAKPKTTVAKAKKPPRNTAQPPKTTRTNAQKNQSTAARSKFTEFKSVQPTKVEINVGQRKITKPAAATNSNSDDLFEELIDDGNSNRDDRNYSAAEAAYKRARTIKPRDSRAVYGLGNLYSDQQRWEEAENSYRAAVQLEPSNAIAHIALSYVLTQPIAAPNLSQRYEEAEQVARRAIDLAPSNALAFDQLGVALEMRGLIGAETENAYRKAIQLRSSFAPAYAHLGRLLRRRGLTRESEAAYKSAVGRSTDIATTILVADVMQSEQRFAESEALLRSSLAGDPKNPSALLLLGRALTAQAKYAEAEKVLRSSLNVSPNAFTANSLLATVYVRQGSFDLAENALLQAVRFVSPLEKRSLSQQFESLGDGYLKAGNASGAERSYRQAIGLDNENQSLVGKLAKAQRG